MMEVKQISVDMIYLISVTEKLLLRSKETWACRSGIHRQRLVSPSVKLSDFDF